MTVIVKMTNENDILRSEKLERYLNKQMRVSNRNIQIRDSMKIPATIMIPFG